MWNYLLLIFVFTYQPLSYSSEFIHSVVSGSLIDQWKFDFIIFANNFRGVILHSFDTNNNQFGIIVNNATNNDKKSIRLKFNNIYKEVPLKYICGCDPCDRSKVSIAAKFVKNIINVTCNNHNSESFVFEPRTSIGSNAFNVYPIPLILVNEINQIFIISGNIGPYKSDKNVTVKPMKEQLEGCLYSFNYNDATTRFMGNTTKVLTSCATCSKDLCHGGVCTEVSPTNVTCDCTSVPFNGRYCNRSLTMYRTNRINSLVKVRNDNEIYLKMTWQTLLAKHYCLMEIDWKFDRFLITINGNNILINSKIVFFNTIATNRLEFITVDFVNYYLVVKIGGLVWRKWMWMLEKDNLKINIGFSDKDTECHIFEGAYDIGFNEGELGEYSPSTSVSIIQAVSGVNMTPIIGGLFFAFQVIVGLVVIIIYRRKRCAARGAMNNLKRKHVDKGDTGETEDPANTYSALEYSAGTIPVKEVYDYVPMKKHSGGEMSPTAPPPLPPCNADRKDLIC